MGFNSPQPLQPLNFVFISDIYLLCACVCACMIVRIHTCTRIHTHVMAYRTMSEDSYGSLFSPSVMWILGSNFGCQFDSKHI